MKFAVGWWLMLVGVWPFFAPEHSLFDGPLGAIDLGVHVYGAVLVWRSLRESRWW